MALALNNLTKVDMPLNKETKLNWTMNICYIYIYMYIYIYVCVIYIYIYIYIYLVILWYTKHCTKFDKNEIYKVGSSWKWSHICIHLAFPHHDVKPRKNNSYCEELLVILIVVYFLKAYQIQIHHQETPLSVTF